MSKLKHETREEWFNQAVKQLRGLFKKHSGDYPKDTKVSCGFPSRGGLGKKTRTLGQCWRPNCSKKGYTEIFISPCVDDPVLSLGILVHELCHAATPGEGHKGEFRRLALDVGLVGKMKHAMPGDELNKYLVCLAETLGEYPHSTLDAVEMDKQTKKQTNRHFKCECKDCGYACRITKKWIMYGYPICPVCSVQMEGEVKSDKDLDDDEKELEGEE